MSRMIGRGAPRNSAFPRLTLHGITQASASGYALSPMAHQRFARSVPQLRLPRAVVRQNLRTMSSDSTLSRALARELLAREMSDGRLEPAAEAVYRRLHESLTRSIGQTGYLALVARALSTARERHSALALVALGTASGPWLRGLEKSVEHHGNEAATEAVVEIFAELVELLGRFVGPALAVRLIERGWPEQIKKDKPSRDAEEKDG